MACALVTAAAIFVARGWHGYYPSKLSTTGAEYPEREAVEKVAQGGADVVAALQALRTEQLAFARAARDDFNRLRAEINELERSGETK